MAINNAAVVIEPQAFVALDAARCFNQNIFSNPRVMKTFPYSRHDEIIAGKRLCAYPNTLFFDVQDETQLMMSEFCRLEGPLPYWRVTFFTALALLYQLGFKSVNLIGCTFDKDYAFNTSLRDQDKAENDAVYGETVNYLRQLMPMLKDEGMLVRTCHEKSALDGICDYLSFADAVSEVVLESTAVGFTKLKHKNEIAE